MDRAHLRRIHRRRRDFLTGVGTGGGASRYILLDTFSFDKAAGSVNGTFADTGQARTVTDTNSKLSITGGQLSFATGGVGAANPGLWYESIPRVLGRVYFNTFTPANATAQHRHGWARTLSTSPIGNSFTFNNIGNILGVDNNVNIPIVGTYSGATTYQLTIILRANGGAWYLIKGGTYTNWRLLWIATGDTTATLIPCATAQNSSSIQAVDNITVPVATYVVQPLAYDTFTRSNGSLGSTETAGPDNQGLSALSWTDAIGTWGVASNKAAASATSGGVAIATIPVTTKDCFIEAVLTRSAGLVGLVGRYTDSSNYIYAYHDGTNAGVKQRLAGVETDLVAATAATYSATAVTRLEMDGNNLQLWYNNVRIGTSASINAGLNGAVVGLYTTDTNATFDNVISWATGISTEYSGLDALAA